MKIGFLPVGHTHEDIDQLFPVYLDNLIILMHIPFQVSKYYNFSAVIISLIIDLKKVIEKSFTPIPEVVEVENVRDIKEWLLPHTPPLHDHLKAHQFKFEPGRDGVSRMYYKEWSSDPFWLPESGMCLLQESNSKLVPLGQL